MTMDWSNERYVRVYTRDTADWLLLGWEAQALFLLMLRKVDRAGFLECRRKPHGLAGLVAMPRRVVERALPTLLEEGCVRDVEGGYLLPNFIEAQESKRSDRARAKESRERRRRALLTPQNGATTPAEVSRTSQNVTERHVTSHDVTRGHATSHDVTLRYATPRRTTPRQSPTPKKHPTHSASVFAAAWEAYPKRGGGNSRRDAAKAWDARIAEGADPELMLAGARRYAAYCESEGMAGTKYVMQAARFFGPSCHFEELWEPHDKMPPRYIDDDPRKDNPEWFAWDERQQRRQPARAAG